MYQDIYNTFSVVFYGCNINRDIIAVFSCMFSLTEVFGFKNRGSGFRNKAFGLRYFLLNNCFGLNKSDIKQNRHRTISPMPTG